MTAGTAIVVRGDALALPLPDASMDLIVTSPPYFALRSYRDGGSERYAGQVGVEASPQEYVAALLAATREMMRVLKPGGSIFVNLGDKYAGSGGDANSGLAHSYAGDVTAVPSGRGRRHGGRAKSLLGLPWRYALACSDDLGLILRAEIVWSKPNPLPDSAGDRVGRSHEQWFHLTKEPLYYSAFDVLRAPLAAPRRVAGASAFGARNASIPRTSTGRYDGPNPLGALPGSVWEVAAEPFVPPPHLGIDHHAAFPMEWPRRFVLGASPPGICVECGEGRAPVVERQPMEWRPSPSIDGRTQPGASFRPASGTMLAAPEARLLGWRCACTPYTDHPGTEGRPRTGQRFASETGRDAHPHGGVGMLPRTGPWREYHLEAWVAPRTRPAVILDPFGGTGTTALVAAALGRTGVTVDRSGDYCRLARWRTTDRAQIAKALRVPKPPDETTGQLDFGSEVAL